MSIVNDFTKYLSDITDVCINDSCNIDNSKDQYGKTYQFIKRSSKPIGILNYNSLMLKLYHMERETEAIPENISSKLEEFLINEIDKGEIKTGQNVGFAILSQGFLSVNLWSRGNVLFTQTYTIEKNKDSLYREPLEKTGVACTWESRIMGFEYEQWQKYLESDMKLKDKKKYLSKFIEGDL